LRRVSDEVDAERALDKFNFIAIRGVDENEAAP